MKAFRLLAVAAALTGAGVASADECRIDLEYGVTLESKQVR